MIMGVGTGSSVVKGGGSITGNEGGLAPKSRENSQLKS